MYVDLFVIISFEYLANPGYALGEEGLIYNSSELTNLFPQAKHLPSRFETQCVFI